jgi:hypothetical protein
LFFLTHVHNPWILDRSKPRPKPTLFLSFHVVKISTTLLVISPTCLLHPLFSLKNLLHTRLILATFMHFAYCSFHIIFVLSYSLLVDSISITCILIQITLHIMHFFSNPFKELYFQLMHFLNPFCDFIPSFQVL